MLTMCGYTLSMGSLVPRTAVLRPPGGGTLPSMSHTRLERMLGIPCVLMLVVRRRISWVGHVLRMGEERAPRRMISSWVPTARPRGRPHLSFSQGLKKDLEMAGLTHHLSLADDRDAWRPVMEQGGRGGGWCKILKCSTSRPESGSFKVFVSGHDRALGTRQDLRNGPFQDLSPGP